MKYSTLFVTIFIFLGIVGCSDIFERQPLDKISSAAVWEDLQLIDANLADLYVSTPFRYSENSSRMTQPSYMGAEAYVHNAADSWIDGSLNETGGVWEYWAYDQIRRINTFIQNVSQSPIDEDIRERRLAEARFLRAYAFFEMVKRYGGVPIITEAQSVNDPEEELFVSRNSEKEVYDFIAQECDAVATSLHNVSDEFGRVTEFTALALKSRAMLYAASIATFGNQQLDGLLGFPSSEATSYWQKSYDASKEIINSGNFSLYNGKPDKAQNFQHLFLDEQNTEIIFAKVYHGRDKVGHSYDFYNYPAGFENYWGAATSVYLETIESFEYSDGSSGKLNYEDLQSGLVDFDNLFENKDPRFFASILFPEAPFKDSRVRTHGGTFYNGEYIIAPTLIGDYNGLPWYGQSIAFAKAGTHFPVKKMINELEDQALEGESHTDFIVYRYGEILLNLAEAAFEIGKTDEALEYINQVRARAGIASLTDLDRNKIRQERRVELAFEEHRFWDLRRWRIAVEELSKEMHKLSSLDFDWDTKSYKVTIGPVDPIIRNFKEAYYYFPIGITRISNNPNLAPENPGYN
ncbi:RagB/SusD family nutrient uptake outer membrane protein [Arenibacter sp. ARW7G5Y1]|uniref:RagB/SusD family nutrient uptake outer membrane protein n=1 Tax=Arenibacter sp. ARW7G5Y1 TaxID=2135619 RepID=UPI000D75EEFF|nr:RagB/SusD family nutrient uptake outer membrane protein [Arenibacter sp. ARW7G5Y1]PXX21838.1 putative outer membrane starch-binding protein [Arenibacter sp. ARW7G5Y1]